MPSDIKTCIVTGATGAIGKAIARQLVSKEGYRVVLVGRDESRMRQAADEIARQTGEGKVSFEVVDLSRQEEIVDLSARWSGPLHVLINNAATTPRRREETAKGIELQFATNVLGYFWMIHFFRSTLVDSVPSRVINVASYWAGDLNLDDLEFKRRRYSNGTAYRQSKQANRMLTVAFSRRLSGYGVAVNSCHPGDVNSKLSNQLGFGGSEDPDQAARTPVWLATDLTGQQETGKYFENMRARHDRFAEDDDAIETLYQICLSYTH